MLPIAWWLLGKAEPTLRRSVSKIGENLTCQLGVCAEMMPSHTGAYVWNVPRIAEAM